MKLSTILCLSLFAIGIAKAHSAIDANGAVDGVFTQEDAAALDAEKHSLVTTLARMVAAATPNLRSIDPLFNEEEDSPPLLRGSFNGKDSVNPELGWVNPEFGWVDCIKGYTSSGYSHSTGYTSCYEACNNGVDCCGPSTEACFGFTGKIARDGSCMGPYACWGGSVGSIIGASCVGEETCMWAGRTPGTTGGDSVVSISGGSCVGSRACKMAGNYDGSVGPISEGSCFGEQACESIGKRGIVGSISGWSCVGQNACQIAGVEGSVGSISVRSCVGQNACRFIGYDNGIVGAISQASCTGNSACLKLGAKGGIVGAISVESCNGQNACQFTGYDNGIVGAISEGSCTGNYACQQLGYSWGGVVGDLTNCCRTDREWECTPAACSK